MELIFIIVIILIFIVAFGSSKTKDEKKERNERVAELLTREYKKKEEELTAKRDAILEKTENMKKAEDDAFQPIADSDMLITKGTFEEMCQLLKDTCNMVMDACRESEFQKYVLGIKEGNDSIDTSQKMFGSLKFFIMKDVLRNYGRLGHRYYSSGGGGKKICTINYETPEGQLLFGIVMQMMRLDDNKQYPWEECKTDIKSRYQYTCEIRTIATKALNEYANANVKATASNGLDDFAFCIIFHNYSKEYETAYRKKMLRMATLIANADGKVSSVANEWLDSIMNPYGSDDSSDAKKEIENQFQHRFHVGIRQGLAVP